MYVISAWSTREDVPLTGTPILVYDRHGHTLLPMSTTDCILKLPWDQKLCFGLHHIVYLLERLSRASPDVEHNVQKGDTVAGPLPHRAPPKSD